MKEYFWALSPNPAQFIAITDFRTPLMMHAQEKKYRHIFINPTDIGGRFAALSYFGLIPYALMGGDVIALMEQAHTTHEVFSTDSSNAAQTLTQRLFDHHQAGRNKLYFEIAPSFVNLRLWIEQLVAESTGKSGFGLLPVLSGAPHTDGFVETIQIQKVEDLAHEFLRWECATAMLGAMLKINPFDEPNVVQSKQNTTQFLQNDDCAQAVHSALQKTIVPLKDASRFIEDVHAPSFVAILNYTHQDLPIGLPKTCAVSHCRGPRYLHSTGQYHKGGPNQGHFVVVVDEQKDLPIPGRPYGFQTLKLAQALGDYEALKATGRKVVMVQV